MRLWIAPRFEGSRGRQILLRFGGSVSSLAREGGCRKPAGPLSRRTMGEGQQNMPFVTWTEKPTEGFIPTLADAPESQDSVYAVRISRFNLETLDRFGIHASSGNSKSTVTSLCSSARRE
eukprot:2660646-Amphidinium_carterae.1